MRSFRWMVVTLFVCVYVYFVDLNKCYCGAMHISVMLLSGIVLIHGIVIHFSHSEPSVCVCVCLRSRRWIVFWIECGGSAPQVSSIIYSIVNILTIYFYFSLALYFRAGTILFCVSSSMGFFIPFFSAAVCVYVHFSKEESRRWCCAKWIGCLFSVETIHTRAERLCVTLLCSFIKRNRVWWRGIFNEKKEERIYRVCVLAGIWRL